MNRLFESVSHAEDYAKFRPTYPKDVIEAIVNYSKGKQVFPPFEHVLDVGCGSGQSTCFYAPYAKKITGIDISENQVSEANKNNKFENISYVVGRGEKFPIEDSSVDVVNCGLAIHWIDTEEFFKECKRVLKPKGIIAVFGTDIPHPIKVGSTCDKYTDQEMKELSNKTYDRLKQLESILPWKDDIKKVQDRYVGVFKVMPGEHKIRIDTIEMKKLWPLQRFYGTLTTWSAHQTHMTEKKKELERELDKEVTDEMLEKFDLAKQCIDDIKNIWGVKEADNNLIEALVEWDFFLLLTSKPFG